MKQRPSDDSPVKDYVFLYVKKFSRVLKSLNCRTTCSGPNWNSIVLLFNDFYTLKKIFHGQEPVIFHRGITGRPFFCSAFFMAAAGTVQILQITVCELFLCANYFTLVARVEGGACVPTVAVMAETS